MLAFLANGLVIAGAGILVGSLISVRQLIAQLPPGEVRHRWHILRVRNVCVII